ncbi:MAG: DUF364 domain-containing protein [Dehalococcoidales bacterium]
MSALTSIEIVRNKLVELVKERKAEGEAVIVTVGALSPLEAIGNTERKDYAILEGKEVMIQAQFGGGYGQAFTDSPREFKGTIEDVLSFDLSTNGNRAIMVATLNAIASHLGIASGVIHCRNEEPAKCGGIIAEEIKKKYGNIKIGMIGLQPAILESLVNRFGADNVNCTDMNPNNIGQNKAGIIIRDGKTETGEMIKWADLILATGSTVANGSFDEINKLVQKAGKKLVLFGITGASVCAITGIERICPYGH